MFWKRYGKIEKRIFDPSSGGIGTRLNVAKTKLMKTIVPMMEIKAESNDVKAPKRKSSPKKRAMQTLATGPATATMASPQRWLRKLYGLKGTGLAQPMIKPPRK